MANRFLSRTAVEVRCTLVPGGTSNASAYAGIDLKEYSKHEKYRIDKVKHWD